MQCEWDRENVECVIGLDTCVLGIGDEFLCFRIF